VIEIFFEIKEPLAISFSFTPAMVGYWSEPLYLGLQG
jgi:hypothetical protein